MFLWHSFAVVAGGRTGFCGLPSSSNTCLTVIPPLPRSMCVRPNCVPCVQLFAVHHLLRDPLQCLYLASLSCGFGVWLILRLSSTLFVPSGNPPHLVGCASACRSVSALYYRANARVLFMALVSDLRSHGFMKKVSSESDSSMHSFVIRCVVQFFFQYRNAQTANIPVLSRRDIAVVNRSACLQDGLVARVRPLLEVV